MRRPNHFDGQLHYFGRVCFKNNVFEHNTRYFKQLNGAAIGTKFAPPCAILFMGYLEDTILLKNISLGGATLIIFS